MFPSWWNVCQKSAIAILCVNFVEPTDKKIETKLVYLAVHTLNIESSIDSACACAWTFYIYFSPPYVDVHMITYSYVLYNKYIFDTYTY